MVVNSDYLVTWQSLYVHFLESKLNYGLIDTIIIVIFNVMHL